MYFLSYCLISFSTFCSSPTVFLVKERALERYNARQSANALSFPIGDNVFLFIYLFMYRVSLFSRLSVPEVLTLSSLFFPVDQFCASFLSHSSCYFLYPRISKSSLLSSRRTPSQMFRGSLLGRSRRRRDDNIRMDLK